MAWKVVEALPTSPVGHSLVYAWHERLKESLSRKLNLNKGVCYKAYSTLPIFYNPFKFNLNQDFDFVKKKNQK